MANTVFQHKRSGTPANVPSSLELGEIAINYADGLIFYKNTTGQIVSISSGGNSFGTINANGTLVVADTPGDVLSLVAGNNVTFSVDAVNDKITINASGGGGGGDITPAFDVANAAFLAANSAFANGNTNFGTVQVAFDTANAAFANGNTTFAVLETVFLQANTARNHANSAFANGNTTHTLTIAAFDTANVAFANGNTNFIVLQTVFGVANDAYTQANIARTHANSAFANGNTTHTLTIESFNAANAAFTQANTAFVVANAANTYADSISAKLFEDTVNATRYVIFDDSISGNFTQANVSPSGLRFNPSTRTLTSNNISVVQALGVGTAPSATTGEIRATNNITAYYSDKRLKTNIQKITNALEKIQNINGVTFQPNEVAEKYGYTNKKTQVGVIAQEVEKVLPQVVVPAPFDIGQNPDGTEYSISGENYKTVQYEKIIPLLIEAIKELKVEIYLMKGKE